MFIRYLNRQAVEGVGLTVSINAEKGGITLHHFMTWVQLHQHVGHDVSLAHRSAYSPPFLYDTDVIITILVALIQGLVFVFYIDDPV